MPYKGVGQVKNASIHAVLNTEYKDGGIRISVYATERYENARIYVTEDGKELYSEETLLSPVDVFDKDIKLSVKDEFSYKVTVSAGGKELVSYQAEDQGIPEKAESATAPAEPEKMLTNEELYLTAQHIEQYRHATWLPDPYYLEGLKRDPDDVRINNAYGTLLLRRGCFKDSEKYFKTSIKRLTGNGMFMNPYDGEAFYDLGLSYFYQEKYDEAYDAFFKATWTNELQEMSFYYLAAIDVRRKEYERALELIEKGLVKNAHNIKARGLKAVILSKLGKNEEVEAWIKENLKLDHFDYVSRFTYAFINNDDPETLSEIHSLSRDFYETFLMCARDFAESGSYEEAIKVLDQADKDKPMIHYYKAYYLLRSGGKGAEKEIEKGEKSSSLYCFPNKLEDKQVLCAVTGLVKKTPKALYYLGCLYYDKLQFEEAVECWERSAAEDPSFATVFRNLAIAYYNKRGEKKKALECMEKAFELDRSDARVFLELDQLYQKLQVPFEKRYGRYKENIGLIERRDDLYTEYVTLLNLMGRHKEAYDAIISHDFQTWEGAEGKITTQFKVSLVEQGLELMKSGKLPEAEKLFLEAVSYPENLGEGRLEGTKDNNIYYDLGMIYKAEGNEEKAREYFEMATLGAMEPAGMMYYYDQPADMILFQGLSLEELGRKKEACSRFHKLVDYGEAHIRDIFKMDYFAVSMPDMSVFDADMDEKNRAHCYYLMGLGALGLGKKDEAVRNFDRVLEIDINHQNAALYRKMALE